MEWCDDALVIGVRHHGETGVIVDLLTRERGRQSGFVHGGRSRRLRAVLQPGNTTRATWKVRGENQLGTVTLEGLRLRAASAMDSARGLHCTNLVCAHMRLLPEREPQPLLYALAEAILDHGDQVDGTPAALVRLELLLLRELGFGLALDRCAVTGESEDLAFVSPKTGRAVGRVAGTPYRDRILALPAFLLSEHAGLPQPDDVAAGFRLTEFFLLRDVFRPRGLSLPPSREAYLGSLARSDVAAISGGG